MAKDTQGRSSGVALSVSLLLAVALVAFLAYALVVRVATPRVDPLRETNPASLEGSTIQVEVLNGCGVDRLAADARRYMKDRGFDIVGVGNYSDDNVLQSFVVDHVGDGVAAAKVASSIGIPVERVLRGDEAEPLFDATVVIGHDYRSLRPFVDT